MKSRTLTATLLTVALASGSASAEDTPDLSRLRDALTFHAPFDGSPDAAFARGEGRIHHTPTGKPADAKPGLGGDHAEMAKGAGRFGDALRFTKKSRSVVFFPAAKNVAYSSKNFSGTVSLWMSLDPAKDLEPGYSDPIQITDKKWNDASFFVDFTKDNPRDFRLGIFSDYKFWNPTDRKWDDVPEKERPMVTVKEPPFARGRWTHVVFTFEGLNREKPGSAKLYMNGKLEGSLDGRQVFTWNPSKTAIMLGLSYIGLVDELAIFDRALSAEEVGALHGLKGGVGSLGAGKG